MPDEDGRNVPVPQPPGTWGRVDHSEVQHMLGVDVADGDVMDKVRTSDSVLRICRSIWCREVVDGAAVIHALRVGVVGENREPRVELAANCYLQPVVVGGSNVAFHRERFEIRERRCFLSWEGGG